MTRLPLLAPLAAALLACASAPRATSTPPAPPAGEATARPLAGIAEAHVVVAPVAALAEGDLPEWSARIPGSRDFLRQVDSAIAVELSARGTGGRWVFANALERAYRRNASLSADPHALSVGPLRAATKAVERVPDPLASQLRAIVALQDDARLVLLPYELRFERGAEGGGTAALRLALVDARSTEVRWTGTVRSSVRPGPDSLVVATLAAHLADLVAAR